MLSMMNIPGQVPTHTHRLFSTTPVHYDRGYTWGSSGSIGSYVSLASHGCDQPVRDIVGYTNIGYKLSL